MNRTGQPSTSIGLIEAGSNGAVVPRTDELGSSADAARLRPQPSNRSRPSVELHIEELVLHGFEFSQQRAIGDAVERELAQLLAEQDGQTAIGRIGEIAHMDAGAFEINSQSSADTIGIQVARAIYGGFSQ